MRNRLHTGTLQHLENLPHTWNLVNLSEFTNLEDGIKPGPFGSSLTKDFYTSSGYRVYGQEQVIAGDLNIGDYFISSSKYLELRSFSIQANDILLSLVGTTGKVLVVPDSFYPGVINPRLIRLRPNLRQTVVGYLKHLLESSIVRHQLNRLSQGGTMEVLSATVLRQLKLPKPSNLPEQRSIAHILDTIDEAIATTTAHIDKLKLAKAGLLHDLLTRGIDDNGELRDPTRHPEQFKDSELGLIPKDWDAVSLSSVAGLQVGYAFKSEWFAEDKGINLMRGENVGYGNPDWSDIKRLPLEIAHQFKEYGLFRICG
jgi:type I restriction enzyme S subunit